MENLNEEVNYVFSKHELDAYDLDKTKENVEELIAEYKKAQCTYLTSQLALQKITTNYSPKYSQTQPNSNDKIGNNITQKLDSKDFIECTNEILKPLLEKLTNGEKKYYSYCLMNDNSDRAVADIIGISRTKLLPVKENCILKIALAFDIAIKK